MSYDLDPLPEPPLWPMIVFMVLLGAFILLTAAGCMTQSQKPTATLELPPAPAGSYTIIVVGAQIAAKPVDLGGIISPVANAAASQTGNPVATQEAPEP